MTIRIHYLDASALIKLLVREDGSPALCNYIENQSVFCTTSLCLGEALGRFKSLYLQTDEKNYIFNSQELLEWVSDGAILIEEPKITQDLVREVTRLIKQYRCGKHKLDVADAFQIVTLKTMFRTMAIGESIPILITADGGLAEAARKENLRVWNCLTEPTP